MKNKEKYFDEIIESFTGGEYTVCDFKKDHVLGLETCTGISCVKCCQRTKEWLEQEYQEPITLTDDEKVILKNLPREYEWIAKDESGRLFLYLSMPQKSGVWWQSESAEFNFSMFGDLFQFIKWEDENPYNIDELLKQNGVER